AEGLPGLHPHTAAERRDSGPGGEGPHHPGGPARITPGVRPGCPGHCSSYGWLCRNQGRCVERTRGFSCDCGLSAYTGAFCHRDKLEVRYQLGGARDAEVLRSRVRNLADGQLHTLTVHRHLESVQWLIPELDPELARLALLGFTGCLSVVQFNSISPLKAALIHPDTSPVTISGPLVQSKCGSSAPTNADAAENTHHLSGGEGKLRHRDRHHGERIVCAGAAADAARNQNNTV
ncbi:hypothetical protein NHX12_004875, partial [Muraenolepis orangiensis]